MVDSPAGTRKALTVDVKERSPKSHLSVSVRPGAVRTVVRVAGEADFQSYRRLETAMTTALAGRAKGVDVDFSRVTFCDCHALNVLLRTGARAAENAVGFRLRGPLQPVVQRLLDATDAASALTDSAPGEPESTGRPIGS